MTKPTREAAAQAALDIGSSPPEFRKAPTLLKRLLHPCVKGVASGDHVHILVRASPELAPSEIMSRIKGRTASTLFKAFPHLKKRDWRRHFWARGYFCATVRLD
jgi:hypothetical protein